MWSVLKDLNPRPPAPKAGALPDCAKHGGVRVTIPASAYRSDRSCHAATMLTDTATLLSVALGKPDAEAEREQNLGAGRYSDLSIAGLVQVQPYFLGVSGPYRAVTCPPSSSSCMEAAPCRPR